MGKHVQEPHHGIPEAAVRQTLLVSSAGSLRIEDDVKSRGGGGGGWVRAALPPQVPESWPYLDVLSEAVEHLFSYRHGFGEVPLALFIDDILARVVPVEVTDGFLWGREAGGIMEPRAVPLASGSSRTRLASLPHLQPQEIVHCTDDYVDGGRISGLCP